MYEEEMEWRFRWKKRVVFKGEITGSMM